MTTRLRTPRERAHDHRLADLYVRERLARLPDACGRLEEYDDPGAAAELTFRDLPYRDIARLALEHVDVRAGMALLPEHFRWPR